jgi:hypothetical protein
MADLFILGFVVGAVCIIVGIFHYFSAKQHRKVREIRVGDIFINKKNEHNPFEDETNACIIKDVKDSTDGNIYVKHNFSRVEIMPDGSTKVIKDGDTLWSEKSGHFFFYGIYRYAGNINDQV